MTVSYNRDVSSVSALSFFRIIFRWRGSIWKSVCSELLLWFSLYYVVFFIYRYYFDEEQKDTFERIALNCDEKLKYIPLTFMLGFFVTIIVDRWRQIFNNMGFIENCAFTFATLVRGDTPEIRLARRSMIRYLVLSQVLVFRDISMKVRRRFPNLAAIQKAGFLHEHEAKLLEKIEGYTVYWVPINWALTLCSRLHRDGIIVAPPSLNTCLNEVKAFRTNLALLCNFDWVPIPIAYPQLVFFAVRIYFCICLVSRQYIISDKAANKSHIDLLVPFMTMLEFIFYVGWMKVAEALLNPLGEDDDDFECNFLIDKNIVTGMSIVDLTYDYCPELRADLFEDPSFSPIYSEESAKHPEGIMTGSVAAVQLASKTENVKMVAIDRRTSLTDINASANESRARTTMRLRRGLSNALHIGKRRAHSVHPIYLGESNGQNQASTSPERPYNAFDLSNGFLSALGSNPSLGPLEKVDEESADGSIKSTVESINEEDVHRISSNNSSQPMTNIKNQKT